MAEINSNNPTLLDLARAKDPDGNPAQIIEMLNQRVDVLQDVTFMEGNLDTGHRTTIRAGLPTPTFTGLYERVQPTKGTLVQVEDTAAILEDYSEIAANLVDIDNNREAYRLGEDAAHMEGFYQKFANSLFYSDEDVSPKEFTGLAPRYNSLSADNAENIIDAGGTGSDNRSIWLVVWGPQTCHGIVPKGFSEGIQMEDKGKVTSETSDGMMEVYRTYMRMAGGLTLKDWRYVVRIANIDASLLSANSGKYTPGTGFANGCPDIHDLMFQAMSQVPSLAAGRPVFYMDRLCETSLGRQASAKSESSTLTAENAGGQFIRRYHSVPIRRVDALASDEARIV